MDKETKSLEAEYDEVEEDELLEIREPDILGPRQRHQIWKTLTKLIRERSLTEKLDPEDYRMRLSHFEEFLTNLKYALSPAESEDYQTIWSHKSDFIYDYKKLIHRSELLSAAADYLARPWMQHNEIDWILLDALIYSEITTSHESMIRYPLGRINWAYAFAGGDIKKMIWTRLKMSWLVWIIRYLLPPAIIAALFFLGYQTATLVTAALYLGYLTVHLFLWPSRHRERKKEESGLHQASERIYNMITVYHFCSPPVISPITLQKQLAKATDAGAFFDGSVFAILNRVIARDREVFLPFHNSNTAVG